MVFENRLRKINEQLVKIISVLTFLAAFLYMINGFLMLSFLMSTITIMFTFTYWNQISGKEVASNEAD